MCCLVDSIIVSIVPFTSQENGYNDSKFLVPEVGITNEFC